MNAFENMTGKPTVKPWPILVVDDEPGLHDVTRLVLRKMSFNGRPVELISAFSAQEARQIIKERKDIAVALVDVVMENDQAGLTLVREMRSTYKMALTRIILRTGNPGLAPEREVIQHFQIDDYRDKTELTSDRLYTSVYTALRAYQTLTTLEQTAEGLEHIITSAATLYQNDSFIEFIDGVMEQIAGIAGATDGMLLVEESLAAVSTNNEPTVAFGTGPYKAWMDQPLQSVAPKELVQKIGSALQKNTLEILNNAILLSLESPGGKSFAFWIPTAHKPEAHVIRLLKIFAEKFKLNVENARLHEEILQAQQTALSKLCEAVEMRSKETGQHIYRMAKYSKLLATLLGLPAEQIRLIEAAAPLHDIGKVAIPDVILMKTESLSPREMEIMRSHAMYGWELLNGSSSQMLQLGADIAKTHHERWDGNGYPYGLKGKDIPLHGRIISIADVFDALMSRRAYKEPFPFDRTMSIIEENAGAHFDPELVALLTANSDKFLEIFRAYPDQP